MVKTESFEEAAAFYQENQSYFNVEPSDFQNQSVYLNSIFINQRLKNYAKADSLFRRLSIDSVHPSLRAQYTSLHIRQFIRTRNADFINAKIQKEAELHGIGLLHNLYKEASTLDLPELDFLWEIIEADINKKIEAKDFNKNKTQQLLFGLDLLMHKYQNKSTAKMSMYQTAYADISHLALANEVEINHYISEVKRVEDLFDKLIIQNKELNHQKSIQKLWFLLALLLLTILVISILYYRKKIQLKQNREEILTKEKELLERENAVSRRMVTLSKELIGFTKKIKSELDQINLSGDNADFLRKFRSELMGFVSVNLEENPSAVDYSLENELKQNKIPTDKWDMLNKTEKRVYSLIKDGFKPSEIASMLGVSTQHIYNLKNKLKRKGLDLENF
jgi:DNA-binding CsgD family transcriptional regulator